jgi:hypothetical protein
VSGQPEQRPNLILPGDPEFHLTLSTALPPGWREVADHIGQNVCFVASVESGILRPATPDELNDYLWGGEYDQRLEENGDVADNW